MNKIFIAVPSLYLLSQMFETYQRELQKETTNEIADKIGIDKKLFKRMARAYFKANFKEEVQENTDFEEFYTTVMEKTAS